METPRIAAARRPLIGRWLVAAVSLVTTFAAGPWSAPALGQTIGLYELARFDLTTTSNVANPEFIGSNPIGVGWNGSKLYVNGFNGSGGTTNTAIVEITNASSVTNWTVNGFVSPTYSSTFGTISAPTTRGYTGLTLSGTLLAASWDGGSNSTSSFQLFNASANSLNWNLSASGTTLRGYAGPGFDPGWNANSAQGGGFAFLNQGAGRRQLIDLATGTNIYGSTTGMIINTTAGSTNWRDIGFDPVTGNLYTRSNNSLSAARRTGANSVVNPQTSTAGQSALIWTATAASNQVATNLGYMNGVQYGYLVNSNTFAGDLIVFNDRPSTSLGQAWTDVIKFVTPSGSSVTPSYTFLATPATGNSAYDFQWDSTTQTLAVLDYTNRTVSIFSTAVPEPATWAMLSAGGAMCGGSVYLRSRSRRRRRAA